MAFSQTTGKVSMLHSRHWDKLQVKFQCFPHGTWQDLLIYSWYEPKIQVKYDKDILLSILQSYFKNINQIFVEGCSTYTFPRIFGRSRATEILLQGIKILFMNRYYLNTLAAWIYLLLLLTVDCTFFYVMKQLIIISCSSGN